MRYQHTGVSLAVAAALMLSQQCFAQTTSNMSAADPHANSIPPAPPHYRIVILGIPLGGSFATAVGMKGDVIGGYSNTTGDLAQRAVQWHGKAFTDLGTLGGTFSAVLGGTKAGFAETSATEPLGEDFCATGTFLICDATTVLDDKLVGLPNLGGSNGAAFDNNTRGQVVGVSETAAPDPTCPPSQPPFFMVLQALPTVWTKGNPKSLPIAPGDTAGHAFAINNRGEIVGSSGQCDSSNAGNSVHALRWDPNGNMTDLGSLGGQLFSEADSINSRGEITGSSDLPGDTTNHAFVWRPREHRMIDLGTLPGDITSGGSSINARGQIVGFSCDAQGNCKNALWDHGAVYELNTLIPADSLYSVLTVNGISDDGTILGSVVNQEGTLAPAALLVPSDDGSDSAATLALQSAQPLSARPKSPVLLSNLKFAPQTVRLHQLHARVPR